MKKFELITDSAGRWEMEGSPVPMRHKMVREMRELFVPLRGVATFTCWYMQNMVDIRVSDLQINELGYIEGNVEYTFVHGHSDLIKTVVKASCGVDI